MGKAALRGTLAGRPILKGSVTLARQEVACVSSVCPLCGRPPETPYAQGKDFEYGTTGEHEWTFWRCASCRILALSPRPADSELARIYPENYYAYDFSSQKSLGYKVKTMLDRRSAGSYLRYAAAPGNILDVGCGDGRLLRLFAGFGVPKQRLYGIELSEEAVAATRRQGFQVEVRRLEEAEYPPGSFVLVVLQQVIEHVSDPRATLGQLHRLLAPGGAVVLETPNTASWDHWLFRARHWGGYHIPRHFFLFEKLSLAALLRSCGFEVVETRSLASPMFWIYSLHNWMKERGGPRLLRGLVDPFPPKPPALALFTLLDSIGKLFGWTSNMRVIAVRR
jgi:SAM-dependent methyltransferase